ncbi:amidase [Paraburkholderia jirisanensis]
MHETFPAPISALAMAEAFARRLSSPVEVVTAALDRAARDHKTFISVINTERALSLAEASAERWRREAPLSALDGIPIAWKDLFDIAGLVTTAGSALLSAASPATEDAALIGQAERAGLIAIGKTNLSEFAYSGLGLNPHFGTPTNPAIDRGMRVPGGSSSGAAISVATGVVPVSVGTDTAGSIRIPSAFNGLVGYRASIDRYSRAGMIGLSGTLDTIGPLANTVADCRAFDSAVRGVPFREAVGKLHNRRFVFDPSLLERYEVSDSVASNFTSFIGDMRDAGAQVKECVFDTLTRVHQLILDRGWIGALDAFDTHRNLLDSDAAALLDPRVRARLELGRHFPSSRRIELLAARSALQASFRRELQQATLIMPTVSRTPPLLEPLEANPDLFAAVNMKTLAMTMPASFLDAPVVAMPSGFDRGFLPMGIQLIRVTGDDDALLAVAQMVERYMKIS